MSANVKYARPNRSNFAAFDKILLAAVAGLLVIGTLLVYAGTREWFRSNDLDPEYYLKRHVLNILIGGLLAYGTTLIDYRLLRAYTPFVWGAGVLGLILVLVAGATVNSAKAWLSFPGGFQLQPAELAKISIIDGDGPS
jgi:rod shape determining protein RodA